MRFSDLIRNKTLDFFSSTLPILKADKNLPKLAKYEDFDVIERSDQPYVGIFIDTIPALLITYLVVFLFVFFFI